MQKYIKDRIEEWFKKKSRNTLIVTGPPGSGKTYTVKKLAKKYKLNVVEIDLEEDTKNALLYPSFFSGKDLILFDNVYKLPTKEIRKFIRKTRGNVVIITNDINRIARSIREKSTVVYVPRPKLSEIVAYGKRHGLKDFTNITRDYRQIQYKIEYGSQGYKEDVSLKDIIAHYFDTGEIEFDLNMVTEATLIRNAINLYGMDMLNKIIKIVYADRIGRKEILEGEKWKGKNIDLTIIDRLSELNRRR